jgi:divalent anion:Na+ symporter, DASS family
LGTSSHRLRAWQRSVIADNGKSLVGAKLTALLGGVAWPVAYVVLLVLYVLMHAMFVSQSAHVLTLLEVFLDVAVCTGVPASLMAFVLLCASSYFATITP